MVLSKACQLLQKVWMVGKSLVVLLRDQGQNRIFARLVKPDATEAATTRSEIRKIVVSNSSFRGSTKKGMLRESTNKVLVFGLVVERWQWVFFE